MFPRDIVCLRNISTLHKGDDEDDNNNNIQLHFNICKEIGVKVDNKHSYDYLPKSVETSYKGKVTILWNQKV